MENEKSARNMINAEEMESMVLPGDAEQWDQEETKWKIGNDSCADWAIRKIKEEQDEYGRIQALADEMIAAAQWKLEKAKRRMENNTEYLKSLLAEYFSTVPHKKTKTQESYRLLSGSMVLKHKQPKVMRDEKELVAWLEENRKSDFVCVEKKAMWGDLKQTLVPTESGFMDPETGEIVRGVCLEPVPDEFNITF